MVAQTPNTAPPPPPKKGRKGCLIAVIALLGVAGVVLALLGFGIYQAMQDPEVREAMGAVGGMLTAPARPELQAAGCKSAVVMDMRAFAKLAEKDPDSRRKKEVAQLREMVLVICNVDAAAPAPACGDLAQVFLQATPDHPTKFGIYVTMDDKEPPICAKLYDATGEYLGEAPEFERKNPF